MKRFAASFLSLVSLFSAFLPARADFISDVVVLNRGNVNDPSGNGVGGAGYINSSDGTNSLPAGSYFHLSQLQLNYTPDSTGKAQGVYTYCVDQFTKMASDSFKVTPTAVSSYFSNQKNATEIAYLYLSYGTTSHAVNPASNPSFSVWGHDFALQLAIWDLSLNHKVDPKNPFSYLDPKDPTSPYFNVDTPVDATRGNAAANSYVQQYMKDYLAEADKFASSGGTVVGVSVLKASNSQSVLYAAEGAHINAVPEPSSFILVGLGSACGLTWLGLKRRALALAH